MWDLHWYFYVAATRLLGKTSTDMSELALLLWSDVGSTTQQAGPLPTPFKLHTTPLSLHEQPSIRPSWDTASVVTQIRSPQLLSTERLEKHHMAVVWEIKYFVFPTRKTTEVTPKGAPDCCLVRMSLMDEHPKKATLFGFRDVPCVVVLFKEWSFVTSGLHSLAKGAKWPNSRPLLCEI